MKTKITLPSAFTIFLIINLFLFLLPTGIIVVNKYVEELYSETSKKLFLDAADLFLLNIFLSLFIFILVYSFVRRKVVLLKRFSITKNSLYKENLIFQSRYRYIRKILFSISLVSVLIFFYYVGFGKLMLLGTNIDAWAFRIIGFDDTPHILQIINETARRIFLPFLLVIEFMRVKFKLFAYKSKVYFYGVFFAYVIGIVSTLDRAPFLALIVAFFYMHLIIKPSKKKLLITSIVALTFISTLAIIMTYIQYNMTNVSFLVAISGAQDFLIHRVLTVPSLAAIQLSFEVFPEGSDFLFLKYSRIGAILGQSYIGMESNFSLYVTPVGYIADAWRNGGYTFVIITSAFLGWFSAWFDTSVKKCSWIVQIATTFMYISFVLFLIFGVFYSQGSFAQIIFIILIIKWFKWY